MNDGHKGWVEGSVKGTLVTGTDRTGDSETMDCSRDYVSSRGHALTPN